MASIRDAGISLSRVSRCFYVGYEVTHALRDASFDIQPTKFTAITGPSGSGKLTLVNLIAGLQMLWLGT